MTKDIAEIIAGIISIIGSIVFIGFMIAIVREIRQIDDFYRRKRKAETARFLYELDKEYDTDYLASVYPDMADFSPRRRKEREERWRAEYREQLEIAKRIALTEKGGDVERAEG